RVWELSLWTLPHRLTSIRLPDLQKVPNSRKAFVPRSFSSRMIHGRICKNLLMSVPGAMPAGAVWLSEKRKAESRRTLMIGGRAGRKGVPDFQPCSADAG